MAEKCENCAHADMVISSVVAANEKLEAEVQRLRAAIETALQIDDTSDWYNDALWQKVRDALRSISE